MRVSKHVRTITALLSALALTSACGGSGGGTDARPPSESDLVDLTAPATKPVEQVTWMLSGEPVALDADLDAGNTEDTVLANVCERLFQTQPDFTIQPHLAASVERPEPTTVVYTLRDDVTFHDGSPMTAEDVVWSLERHRADGADESDEFETVTAIEATGDHQVTITLSQPDALFDMRMAGDAGIVWNPRVVGKAGKDFGTPGSEDGCSGPYEVADWHAGSSLTITRHADYWGESTDVGAGTVTFRWAEGSALVNAMNSGDADGVYLTDPSLAVPLAGRGELATYYGPTTTSWQLFPTDKGALTDPRIRKALSLAIDREGIARAAFAGGAEPWRLPVGSGSWGYEREAFEAAYEGVDVAPAKPTDENLAEARDLVDAAGDPGTIVVASDGTPTNTVIANAVRSAAQSIGLSAKTTTMSDAQFGELFSSEQARQTVDMLITDWYLSKPDPIGMFDNMISDGVNNYTAFRDPSFDETVAAASGEYDEAKRAELALELQEVWMENMLTIPLVMAPNTLVLSKGLTGVPASITYLTYPWAAQLGES